MAKNILNLRKEISIQVQEPQSVPNKMNPKKVTPSHIIISMMKVKVERILKTAREEQFFMCKGNHTKISDFSSEALQDRKEWYNIFKVLKRKGKHSNQKFFTWQGYHSELKEILGVFQIAKLMKFITTKVYYKKHQREEIVKMAA